VALEVVAIARDHYFFDNAIPHRRRKSAAEYKVAIDPPIVVDDAKRLYFFICEGIAPQDLQYVVQHCLVFVQGRIRQYTATLKLNVMFYKSEPV
jgi:competence transcription factor ComK